MQTYGHTFRHKSQNTVYINTCTRILNLQLVQVDLVHHEILWLLFVLLDPVYPGYLVDQKYLADPVQE